MSKDDVKDALRALDGSAKGEDVIRWLRDHGRVWTNARVCLKRLVKWGEVEKQETSDGVVWVLKEAS